MASKRLENETAYARERRLEYHREYYWKNRDRVAIYMRAYRKRPGNAEKANRKAKEWYQRHKHRYQEENAWVRSAITENGWTLSGFSEALGYNKHRASQWVMGLYKAPTALIEATLGIKKEDYIER